MKTVDEILAIIDTGLQTAGDTAYGDDWPHTCWRCGDLADDLCDSCRSVLLDETTTDAHLSPFDVSLAPAGSSIAEAIERLNEAFNQISRPLRRRILEMANRYPAITGTLRSSNDRNNTRSTSE